MGIFVRATLPRRTRVAKVHIDICCQREVRVVYELLSAIPSQGFVEFARQFLSRFDQGGDDALGVLVGAFDQHDIARFALHKGRDVAVLGAADQVTFPMTWNGAVLDRCGSFAD